MKNSSLTIIALSLGSVAGFATPGSASTFAFSTGNPDGRFASASRQESGAKFEIETGDDFVLSSKTALTGAHFTGLLPEGVALSDVTAVTVEIYRVFPKDSDVGRTTGAPVFGTPQVPTRVNSPSDVAFADRASSDLGLSFTTSDLGALSVGNSLQPGGIHPLPNQTTGGDGAVSGREVQFDVSFLSDLLLDPDHYFFIPQVTLAGAGDDFLWLSAPKPIVPPGTDFAPDLQGWARDDALSPDWLRVGTDIVGAGAFNFAFALDGDVVGPVPLPAGLPVLGAALGALGLAGWRRRRA